MIPICWPQKRFNWKNCKGSECPYAWTDCPREAALTKLKAHVEASR